MAHATLSHRRPVELRRHLAVTVDRAVAILNDAPQHVVGSQRDGFWAPAEAHAVLGAQLLPGTLVTRSVRIGFGPLLEDGDAMVLPVWWEDDEHPNLFPTFDGGLELRAADGGTELRLAGSYQPPLGTFGRFADGVAGHRFVMASLEAFVDDIGARLLAVALDGVVDQRPSASGGLRGRGGAG